MGKLTYPTANIGPWMQELEEIDAILDILYRAKINYLSGLQRVPVSADDTGAGDFLAATTAANQWGMVTPYKITFRGFSAEIAAVMEGFARSSNCFIIQAIVVSQDTTVQSAVSQPPSEQPAAAYAPRPVNPNPGARPAKGGGGSASVAEESPTRPALPRLLSPRRLLPRCPRLRWSPSCRKPLCW